MTALTPSVEEILRKLIEISGGDPLLVQEALSKSSVKAGEAPKLEDVVRYILDERERRKQPQEASLR